MKLTKNFLTINQACPDGIKFAEVSGYIGCDINELIDSTDGDYNGFVDWLQTVMVDNRFVCDENGNINEVHDNIHKSIKPKTIIYTGNDVSAILFGQYSKLVYNKDTNGDIVRYFNNGYMSSVYKNGKHISTIKPSYDMVCNTYVRKKNGVTVVETRTVYQSEPDRADDVEYVYMHNGFEFMLVGYENGKLNYAHVTNGLEFKSITDIPNAVLDNNILTVDNIKIVFDESGYTTFENDIKLATYKTDKLGVCRITAHGRNGGKGVITFDRIMEFVDDKLRSVMVYQDGCLQESLSIGKVS